ncbi:MAG: 23S rRNA (pseudouridine(1915)-N(3))-methyltransferase RlmH [Clostridiales bacterium]|nr:23S rRNA (pseudouridine(1915)-N(3))-methyltransferase RlmH [Clostridiales bacterium]
MVKITFVVVGKLKEAYWRAAVEEYAKRLSRFAKVELRELPERATLKEEAADILRALRGYVFALAVEGKECSSEAFAKKLKALADRGEEITFVIGSSCGLDGSVKAAADELLSFSEMTFPHQMMRVVLFEQVYRAFMINAGAEYHK